MFKKTVFLLIFSLFACQSSPPQTVSPTHDHAAHLHVDPLPHAPYTMPNEDYDATILSHRLSPGKPGQFTLVLENENGTAAQYSDFARMHGERIHVMIIDHSLTDYHHLHPAQTRSDKLAIFDIPFTPQLGGDYVVFADVTPARDQTQRFLSDTLPVAGFEKAPVFAQLAKGTMSPQAETAGFIFKADIEPTMIRVGKPVSLNITVTDKDGQLFRGLEPLMQAFAHLIGFSSDRQYIVHTHPMGREITAENARGGPNLMFHVSFPTSGFYRLFLQVRVEDKILTVPFDVSVAP